MKTTLKQLKRKRRIQESVMLAIGASLFAVFLLQLNSMFHVDKAPNVERAVAIVGETRINGESVYFAEDSRGEGYIIPAASGASFAPYAEIELVSGNWRIKQMLPIVSSKLS